MGDQPFGIDPKVISEYALEISGIAEMGVQMAIVIGGGNEKKGGWIVPMEITWECWPRSLTVWHCKML